MHRRAVARLPQIDALDLFVAVELLHREHRHRGLSALGRLVQVDHDGEARLVAIVGMVAWARIAAVPVRSEIVTRHVAKEAEALVQLDRPALAWDIEHN